MWHWRTSSKKGVEKFLHYIYSNCTIYLDRKYKYAMDWLEKECAHVKPGELLETYPTNDNVAWQSAAEPKHVA
jgi:hypothetical protein